ncbi:aromatic amino acid transaminase [Paenalcaligenes hominis]|uniref:amino acid aminotransferase n=1 Tax=Paenalcaligenes hominis TaxID=643674 RepID=UPI0035240EB9
MNTLFSHVTQVPRDPILGLNELFQADSRPNKINLGVGVYYDEQGHMPLLNVVKKTESLLAEQSVARGYLPIDGIHHYNMGAQYLLLGRDASAIHQGRTVTIQSLGGTGALKLGADFLKNVVPNAVVAISNPSWENHRALFEKAGFPVVDYPYYDEKNHGLDIEGMLQFLEQLDPQSIVVLHACCHNPTGIDPTFEQWQRIAQVIKAKQLIPFMDIAYQGFGADLDEDAKAVRYLADQGIPMLVSSSFSKSFALYGERVGALTVITERAEESPKVLSQLKRMARTNYSNPPTHGAQIVNLVLNDAARFAEWEAELSHMRQRIHSMRHQLVTQLAQHGVQKDMSFILKQQGMFSYSGLSQAQAQRLRDEDAIYLLDTGRICVAALNEQNLSTVAAAIARVVQ